MLSYDNKFFDKTIYTKDTMADSAFTLCVTVRMALGAIIVAGYVDNWSVIALCSLILYVFIGKYRLIGNSSWKCYKKVIIAYLAVMAMQFSNDKSVSKGAGYVIMMEALLGLNSRYLVDKLTSA